ncbi:hypothetical protein K469DRAFT_142747 [Zopfia rhizophila CBS 207.26]|uniref:Uncharacterized protein n=1 Tax=Zopfia rhizophila CBS 207.26 TaxID=1314779 RepID=A0A6A6E6M5_9PEZI|nr:hypothetical protein K469DRAFT_142747 [Zopfia rhizophila CBS 207.26]
MYLPQHSLLLEYCPPKHSTAKFFFFFFLVLLPLCCISGVQHCFYYPFAQHTNFLYPQILKLHVLLTTCSSLSKVGRAESPSVSGFGHLLSLSAAFG